MCNSVLELHILEDVATSAKFRKLVVAVRHSKEEVGRVTSFLSNEYLRTTIETAIDYSARGQGVACVPWIM